MTYIVWLENSVAKIFNVQNGGTEPKLIRRKENLHHTHNDREKHKESGHHFAHVAEAVKDANELLLVGHNQAREHFESYLKEHFAQTLARKVVGSEAADHLTDAQILALSRKFFRKADLFNTSIG